MFDTLKVDDSIIIQMTGELNTLSAPALEVAIAKGEATKRLLLVSLANCTYCDSTGLAVFARAKGRLGERLFVVVPLTNRIRRVFDLTGLTEFLPLYTTVDEALGAPPLAS